MSVPGRTVAALSAAAAVCGAAAVVIVVISTSRHPVAAATILGADLAAVAVAVTLLLALAAWWQRGRPGAADRVSTPSQAAAAADRLAEEMASRWRQEATRRRIVTPAPVNISWRWVADDALPDVTVVSAPGAGPPPLPGRAGPGEVLGAGVVTRLHDEVYARLPHGRLVLTGGPGSGKTGAMILLLLAALDWRARLAPEDRALVPVPVWLTLGRWNPETTSLGEWAAARMNLDHPALAAADYGPGAAAEMLRSGRVALFLDGLDEMPEAARPLALRRLGEEARGLRVVLTSRPEEYAWAAQFLRLWDNVAVVELRPVGAGDAAEYLLHGQSGPRRAAWQRVAASLTEHPDSVAARTLDNPLTLTLAREAYARRDPSELADPTVFGSEVALRGYLVDQIMVTAYPDEQQRAYAVWWLAWVAQCVGPGRDLPWWDVPSWIPRWQLRLGRVVTIAVVVGLINAVALNVISALTNGFTGSLAIGLAANLGHGMATGLLFGLVFGIWLSRHPRPRELVLRWPRPQDLQRVFSDGFTLWVGIFAALIWGFIGAFAFGPAGGLAVAAAIVVAVEFRNLWSIPTADSRSATAAGTYRSDRRATLATALALGLVMLLAGLGTDISVGFTSPLANALANALPFGVSVAAAAWLAVGQAPRVTITEIVLACRRRGRVRLMRLLEDAADRQVLRQAGVMYQFRHATLQDRLAAARSLDPPAKIPRRAVR